MRRFLAAGLVLALSFAAYADEPKDNPAAKPVKSFNQKRHEQFLKVVEKGDAGVIFIGDSITQGWEGAGKKVWADSFTKYKPVNLGIGGEQTTHVLWRITEGKELEPINPKLAVIMIGTNNMGGHTPEQIAGGVKKIVETLQEKKPDMKILLLGIFPRSAKADDKIRVKVNDTNKLLSKLGDNKKVFYKDIGNKFLTADGTLERKIMPDLLHLSPEGYQIWADAIKDDLEKLAK
jgi:lysophospholipase L1-like esterase